jgi:GntR family transcriptional regulator, transcriptional repressor for pyruvate dehydrogenase complex
MGSSPFAALRPLKRSRLFEDLVERLGQLVGEAGMAPGDRFPPERELSERLGVSRTSIRQAMVVLQSQGFVDVRHGEGVFLRRSQGFGELLPRLLERRRRLPEVFEAREALEVKLAELAAVRRGRNDLAAMRRALRRMTDEVAAGGTGIEGDTEFHDAIAAAARNKVLEHVIGGLADAIRESHEESLAEPGRPRESIEAHRRILSAIEERSPQRAAETMRDHLRVVADVALLRWDPKSKEGALDE